MSHSPRVVRSPASPITLARVGVTASIIVAYGAAAIATSMAALAWLNASPAAAESRSAVPPAPPVVPPSPGTGVPDASEVLKGREGPAEEPAPTF